MRRLISLIFADRSPYGHDPSGGDRPMQRIGAVREKAVLHVSEGTGVRRKGGVLETHPATSKSSLINRFLRRTPLPLSHRTWPFRIMFIAS
jgi:hypothetical protein